MLSRGGIAPSGLRAGSLAHAAHIARKDDAFDGHCKVTVRSPALRDGLESADAFSTRWDYRAWT
jgi:hypothetical protein